MVKDDHIRERTPLWDKHWEAEVEPQGQSPGLHVHPEDGCQHLLLNHLRTGQEEEIILQKEIRSPCLWLRQVGKENKAPLRIPHQNPVPECVRDLNLQHQQTSSWKCEVFSCISTNQHTTCKQAF